MKERRKKTMDNIHHWNVIHIHILRYISIHTFTFTFTNEMNEIKCENTPSTTEKRRGEKLYVLCLLAAVEQTVQR